MTLAVMLGRRKRVSSEDGSGGEIHVQLVDQSLALQHMEMC
jgi:hypothetical protein